MAQQPVPPPPPPPGSPAPAGPGVTNGLAIAGMVLGISSVVLFWLSWIATIIGIVGLVLSLVGLSKSKQIGGVGRGMATAGVATSAVGIVASIILLVVVVQKVESGDIILGSVLPIRRLALLRRAA